MAALGAPLSGGPAKHIQNFQTGKSFGPDAGGASGPMTDLDIGAGGMAGTYPGLCPNLV